ncbi:hypothetical protein V1478_010852 [Vespula squamosa]|uniref:Uncharacterized protein n=1 Tax=Vespula squamosa TaxID=30214 RepID=A0ABD2AI99_VESSQ
MLLKDASSIRARRFRGGDSTTGDIFGLGRWLKTHREFLFRPAHGCPRTMRLGRTALGSTRVPGHAQVLEVARGARDDEFSSLSRSPDSENEKVEKKEDKEDKEEEEELEEEEKDDDEDEVNGEDEKEDTGDADADAVLEGQEGTEGKQRPATQRAFQESWSEQQDVTLYTGNHTVTCQFLKIDLVMEYLRSRRRFSVATKM